MLVPSYFITKKVSGCVQKQMMNTSHICQGSLVAGGVQVSSLVKLENGLAIQP